MYFDEVRNDDKVFGLVFGKGTVLNTWDGYYKFEVEYETGHIVPYTADGVPSWNVKFDFQTVFYEKDIHYEDYDFKPVDKILTPKQIVKARYKNKLEVRCPSGFWVNVNKCPDFVVQDYLENNKFHLFRKVNND